MNCVFTWLCWISAGILLSSWVVSAKAINKSSSTPPTDSSAPVGLRGYRRYFANDSFIGRPVPCTRDEKICFRHNLVYDPIADRCEPLERLHVICRMTVNENEESEEYDGKIVKCRRCVDRCPGYRMAYDDICYKKETVEDVICGRDGNLTRHPFGNVECRATPTKPLAVTQPEEDGSCLIPDLRFPDTERRVFYNSPYSEIQGFKNEDPEHFKPKALECGSGQLACFLNGKIFVQGYEGCHKLLGQGPCAEGHVVALDLQAATEGRAEGTCVHVQGGCPKGHKRMLFDGECHENREIEIEAPGEIILNQFGRYIVSNVDVLEFRPKLIEENCEIHFHTVRVIILSSNVLDVLDSCESPNDASWNHVVSERPQPQL